MLLLNKSLATSIYVVVALLYPRAATGIQDIPEDEPVSASPLHANNSDVILVSFEGPWREAHSTFARLLSRPITTWSTRSKAFSLYVWKAFSLGKKPVFFAADPSMLSDTPPKFQVRGVIWFSCLPILFCHHRVGINTCDQGFTTPQSGCEVAGYLAINETNIQTIFVSREFPINVSRGSMDTVVKTRPLMLSHGKGLDSREITAACTVIRYNGSASTCYSYATMKIIEFLKQKNVTIKRKEYFDLNTLWNAFASNSFDMTLEPLFLDPDDSSDFDLPFIRVLHDTFYSRVGDNRVVSLLEVGRGCWKLVATTVTFLALAVFVCAVIAARDGSLSRGICDTALFFLAAVLATPAVLPKALARAGAVRKALLGIWLAILLPLSVYFRSELTTMLTLKRPADRIDTLQKLEAALDRRQVAACVMTRILDRFQPGPNAEHLPQQSLLMKLQLALKQHGGESVATNDLPACLKCASKRDHVCYYAVWSSAGLTRKDVKAFPEQFNTRLVGFFMAKYQPLYRLLTRLFRAIEENRLIVWDERESENESAETEFDMSGLLTLLVVLHATSCVVLGLEVALARCIRRGDRVKPIMGEFVQRISVYKS